MLLSPSFKPFLLGATMLGFGTQIFELNFRLRSMLRDLGFFVCFKWIPDIDMAFEFLMK